MKEVLIVAAENEQFPTWSFREWDLNSGSLIHTYNGDPCPKNGLTCSSPSGSVLVLSNRRPMITTFTPGSIKVSEDTCSTATCPEKINTATYSTFSDNCMLAVSIGSTLQLWDLSSNWKSKDLCGHNQDITKVVFTGNDRFIVSGGKDSLVLVWDVSRIFNSLDDIDPEFVLDYHLMPITDIYSCGPSSPFLVWTCSQDSTCQLLDVNVGAVRTKVEFSSVPLCVCCLPSISELFCGTNDGSIKIVYRKEMMRFENNQQNVDTLHGHRAPVSCISISMCGNLLASGGMDKQVCLWDTVLRQCLRVLVQPGPLVAIAFLTYCDGNNEAKLSARGIANITANRQLNSVLLTGSPKHQNTRIPKLSEFTMSDEDVDDDVAKLQEELDMMRKKTAELISAKLSKCPIE